MLRYAAKDAGKPAAESQPNAEELLKTIGY
jgi:hypothetical protein